MVDRLKQLKAESCLVDGLTALPMPSRMIVKAWYKTEIDNVEKGVIDNKLKKEELSTMMEAIKNAVDQTI